MIALFLKYGKYMIAMAVYIASYFGVKNVKDVGRAFVNYPVAAPAVACAAVILLLWQTIRDGSERRKGRYAYSFSDISAGFLELRKAEALPPHERTLGIKSALQVMCTQLAKAMSTITGTSCAVCLKILSYKEDETGKERPYVVTLVRDVTSQARRADQPSVIHWVDENTDFEMLIARWGTTKGRFFLRNILCLLPEYKNSSFHYHGKPPSFPECNGGIFVPFRWLTPVLSRALAYIKWTLPYKSTLVVPISMGGTADSSACLGFICVDSPQILSFNKNFDVDVVEGVAQGIYPYVDMLTYPDHAYPSSTSRSRPAKRKSQPIRKPHRAKDSAPPTVQERNK